MRINPLYIALLLVVTLLFVMYQLANSKTELRESRNTLMETEAMAEEIDALKRAWDNPKTSDRSLQRLLASPQLKSANIQRTKKRGLTVLKSKKADLKSSDYLFTKLFNGTYILKQFEIKRLDDQSVSFSVEISS
jgi:hypothetical protein